ncbi:unnamed protein product [Bursaphelenchus okinawaensis]|uniref:Uncharacterized protein n=1 Tax=Bursaphelenchus okinawaensis TaxID=465554 RepID=A0A811KFR7_9BILA|nr:unnamed protein product [Bursaphelenchus okinawaensis]CAG9101353.1 unnamed protein product [Bursaphelenchus okinawaensis]
MVLSGEGRRLLQVGWQRPETIRLFKCHRAIAIVKTLEVLREGLDRDLEKQKMFASNFPQVLEAPEPEKRASSTIKRSAGKDRHSPWKKRFIYFWFY